MKIKKIFQIIFIIVGVLTILEFIFVRGMFTWIMAALAVIVVGLVNAVLEAKDKNTIYALNYVLCTVALVMGYAIIA